MSGRHVLQSYGTTQEDSLHRRKIVSLLLVLLMALGTTVVLTTVAPRSAEAAMTVSVTRTDGQGVRARSEPRLADNDGYGTAEGAAVTVECWTWGDAVGSYANQLWWWTRLGDGRRIFVADTYLTTPNRANKPPAGQPQCGSAPPSSSATAPARGSVETAFGKPCAAVTILAIPGSNETTESAGRDEARAMLRQVTSSISASADSSVRTHYLGYPARLIPYGDSRSHGYQAAWSTVNYYAHQCPNTSFILLGYSQGAHIAGDLAATIGHESSPVSADRVRSVRLLADPARAAGFTPVVGGGSNGGLMGGRGDFGSLGSRVTEYCDSADGICNANPFTVGGVAAELFRSTPHTSYSTTIVPGSNKTFTERITADLVQDIVNMGAVTY